MQVKSGLEVMERLTGDADTGGTAAEQRTVSSINLGLRSLGK